VLGEHYATEQAIEGLRGLILNTGTALIGAAAIVTSLVLFAMQVNIERMPHGLFRRLSADPKLLGAFALAFLLAIGVASLSTFVDQTRLAHVVLAASWAIVFILISFMYAYRRALVLINPLRQLGILIPTPGRNCGPGHDGLSGQCPSLNEKKLQVARRHPQTRRTTWPVQHSSRSTIGGPMVRNERSDMQCRLLGAMQSRGIMRFPVRH
jgi:hypothetical protein